MTNKNIGYLSVLEMDTGDIIGALLILDINGYPIEMHYTTPAKLGAMEKIAFGVNLKSGIMIKKIAIPLIENIGADLLVILVNDDDLLKVKKIIKTPLLQVTQSKSNKKNVVFTEDDKKLNNKIKNELMASDLWDFIDEPFQRIQNGVEYLLNNDMTK